MKLQWSVILIIATGLTACANSDNYAPVVDMSDYEAVIYKVSHHPAAKPPAKIKESPLSLTGWGWPAHGRILSVYSSENKGIDIGGHLGDPIYAAASGKVVYAGDGLRSYGKLIILRHNSQYLSAYAYNSHLFVKEGDWVKIGQKIASMGKNKLSQADLHFEIRLSGKPVNPMSLLNK